MNKVVDGRLCLVYTYLRLTNKNFGGGKMKKIVLYIARGNQKYEVKKFNDLGEGHEAFTEEFLKGEFEYLELGIDNVDIDGTYKIVRKINLKQ